MNIDVKAYVWTSITDNAFGTCKNTNCTKPGTHTASILVSNFPGLDNVCATVAMCNDCTVKFLTAALTPKKEESVNDYGTANTAD